MKMESDISFDKIYISLLERSYLIGKMFTQEELEKANNFIINISHKIYSEHIVYKAQTLQEKCFVLLSNFYHSKSYESASYYIDTFKEIEGIKINIKQLARAVLFASNDILDMSKSELIDFEYIASVLKDSPNTYQFYLQETEMTESEFDNFIIKLSDGYFTDCENTLNFDEVINELLERLKPLLMYALMALDKKCNAGWSEEKMMCDLEIVKQLHSKYFNLFLKASKILSYDEEYLPTILALSLISNGKSESGNEMLLLYTYLHRRVYGEDWMKRLFEDIIGRFNLSQKLNFVNFLNLSVEDGGSPYADEFCKAMEQYFYDKNTESSIPLDLVNRRIAILVRDGSDGEYVRVLNRKLKGVNEDLAKEDRILYDNLKKLHYKLIEDGILDKTADEELFIFRLSGLNKPGKLSNLKVKNSIKLGLVLRCLCSDRNNPFPRTKLGSFFITDAGNEPNFSSNTIVTQMEMKKPTPKSNFQYVVTLLEEIGFANVRDVHNGARS